jgi:DNA polymerase/3'-5' exonuclease PolX
MKQAKLFQQDEPELLPELDFDSALALANIVKNFVQIHCEKVEVVGSIRRHRPKIHDVDFVVVTPNDAEWLKIGEELKRVKAQTSCAGNVVIKVYVPCNNGLFQVDFYRAKPSTLGINQLIRTGSADHNMWLAGYAISKGMRIKYSEGLVKDGAVVAGETEEGVFEALRLPCPKSNEREVIDGKPVWHKE